MRGPSISYQAPLATHLGISTAVPQPPACPPRLAEAERAHLRAQILDAWARRAEPSATAIGRSLGISRNVVIGVVGRARAAGDPRAVVRGSPIRPDPRPRS